MKLLYQTHSPYARKVLIFAHEAGIADRFEVIHHETGPERTITRAWIAALAGRIEVLYGSGDGRP